MDFESLKGQSIDLSTGRSVSGGQNGEQLLEVKRYGPQELHEDHPASGTKLRLAPLATLAETPQAFGARYTNGMS